MLLALIGISFQSNSQVILNCDSFEPMFIDWTDYDAGGNWDISYTVPEGKSLIITHSAYNTLYINGGPVYTREFNVLNSSRDVRAIHIPVAAGNTVQALDLGSKYAIIGYLVDADGFGVQIDDSEEEFTSEGGIEIYPNPTGELASVFVDYQGTWNITVYDLNGQIVLESSVNTPVKTIDTSSLSSGTYIVSARAKRKLIGSSQLIVQ